MALYRGSLTGWPMVGAGVLVFAIRIVALRRNWNGTPVE
jgi:hypothetical protein